MAQKGNDLFIKMNLSFNEAVFGVEKNITLTKTDNCTHCHGTGAKDGVDYITCPECHGSGQVRYTQNSFFGQITQVGVCKTCNGTGKKIKEKCSYCSGKGVTKVTKTLKVNVPAGINNEQTIIMREEGEAGLRGGPNGDLKIMVNVEPHKLLVRDEFDLKLNLPISFTTALLGGKVNIPTLEGNYELSIPSCTQTGTVFRLKNKGVQKLLDGVIEYMPAPTDVPDIEGTDLDGNPVTKKSSDDEPFAALAFKIMTDPFVGKLAYFRVYSGTLNSGSYVLNSTKNKNERVGRLLQMHANKRQEIEKVYSGDIAAAVGFKLTTTGDTICDDKHPVILESMVFPEPVIDIAIEPKTKNDQGKMGEALAKLAEEDPTFRTSTNQETGQTIISGMGELHLEIIVDRLLREFKVEANVGAPQVAYKEAMTKPVDAEGKYIRQSGGRGQYGHCKVKFEPMDPNGEETFKFESTVVGGAIPKEYIPAIGEGIEEATKCGILGGFPVLGIHANVWDGSYHEVDSSEMAFHIAGSMAFKDAMQKGSPVLLEPIMRVEVTMPEEYMGDVIGDINSRRGRVEGMEDIASGKMVKAYVPLSEMFGYSTDLRSRTQGRGNYSMFFEKYEQCPKNVQEKILSDKGSKEEKK